jgi:MYXO-CTERM domain-containing protein
MSNSNWIAFALSAAAMAAPAAAQAQQLLVFDEMYEAQQNEPGAPGAFHHRVKPLATQPANWQAPIDYSKGTVYIHQEVMTKPSKRPTIIDICFDGDLEGYGCIDTASYTDVGVHETMKPLADMWQYEKVAWTKKRTEYHLVIKDPALGGTPGGKPPTDFTPSIMRIVFTIVPPGGTYVPPGPKVGGGGADGGVVVMADASTGASPDAAPPAAPDAAAAAMADGASTVADAAPASAPPPATTPPPSTEPTTPPAGTPVTPKPRSSGGCTMARQGSPAGLLLPALALALLRRRRR